MLQRLSNPWEGIDVSKWQGAIDFIQVKASGKKFVIIQRWENATGNKAVRISGQTK